MGKIIFILGGARCGKSSYAVNLAKRLSKKVAFIATATPLDKEMNERIKLHRLSRPKHWKIVEESRDVASAISQLKKRYEVILIDCLGLLITNLLVDGLNDKEIEKRTKLLNSSIPKLKSITIVVSNEVGSGIVPDNPLARRFRDLLGMANQNLAKKADQVILMQSGIPIIIKGERNNAEIKGNNK